MFFRWLKCRLHAPNAKNSFALAHIHKPIIFPVSSLGRLSDTNKFIFVFVAGLCKLISGSGFFIYLIILFSFARQRSKFFLMITLHVKTRLQKCIKIVRRGVRRSIHGYAHRRISVVIIGNCIILCAQRVQHPKQRVCNDAKFCMFSPAA